jgi:hypothetical protein
VIDCGHGGTVQLVASQSTLSAGGAPVLVGDDLIGAVVTNCLAANKPCSSVVSVIGGRAARLSAGGEPALLDSVTGTTDGNPVKPLAVISSGQTVLQAS